MDLDYTKWAVWRHFTLFSGCWCFKTSPPKCFVDYETSADFPSAEDNDWILNCGWIYPLTWWLVWLHAAYGEGVGGDLPSPSGGTWVSIVGVGLEPSSGLRVRKKRKETTIIEVNTIYSPELLNGWDLHMARPRQIEKQTERQIE